MQSYLFKLIAFIFFFSVSLFTLKYWMDTQFIIAENCVHIDKVIAFKDGQTTFNGKNEIGEDKSCYVSWELDGKKGYSEWWNVGNCSDTTPIEFEVVDYQCH